MRGLYKVALWMTLILANNGWNVSWTPHPDNIILQVSTTCNGSFSATSRYTIAPDDSHAVVHRVAHPPGPCYVTAEIRRGLDGDYEGETTAESTATPD